MLVHFTEVAYTNLFGKWKNIDMITLIHPLSVLLPIDIYMPIGELSIYMIIIIRERQKPKSLTRLPFLPFRPYYLVSLTMSSSTKVIFIQLSSQSTLCDGGEKINQNNTTPFYQSNFHAIHAKRFRRVFVFYSIINLHRTFLYKEICIVNNNLELVVIDMCYVLLQWISANKEYCCNFNIETNTGLHKVFEKFLSRLHFLHDQPPKSKSMGYVMLNVTCM